MFRPFLLLILLGLFTGCDHFSLQDFAIKGAKVPLKISFLEVSEPLNLEFRRGILGDRFIAQLGGGDYKSIIQTDNGVFYLAPRGAFGYKNNENTITSIGGIFVSKSDGELYVWFGPRKAADGDWDAWSSGNNIEDMLPGILFVEDRPWVEKDFIIPSGKVTVKN